MQIPMWLMLASKMGSKNIEINIVSFGQMGPKVVRVNSLMGTNMVKFVESLQQTIFLDCHCFQKTDQNV